MNAVHDTADLASPNPTWELDVLGSLGHDYSMMAEIEAGEDVWHGAEGEGLRLARPSTTNVLPRDVRSAMRRSDMKASRLLGVTVTRDDGALFATNNNANARHSDENIVPHCALGMRSSNSKAKSKSKTHAKSSSLSTLVGVLKNMNMHMRIGKEVVGVGKAKKRFGKKEGPRRVVLAPLGPNVSSSIEEARDRNGRLEVSDGDSCSYSAYQQLDDGSRSSACDSVIGTTSESETLGRGNEAREDEIAAEARPFKWDVENPFATPTSSPVRVIMFENISPLDISQKSDENANGDDGVKEEVEGAHEFHVDMDLELDNRRRERRTRNMTRRTRMKTMQILGAEALDAILSLEEEA
ncbi:hypothetical protein SERLA73DRAFT_184000 [Serpula lacrymans var. lacrymans S7.3]|uniref:Uncharacterized protein n=2 Tax=Serpula lacrymans var. lacrymans TaxID=341189 RepID=F8Q2A8_SERL3|nr:uncharacterized protein SERLADRAFT_471434 [Serpula lacrymans var. lacrymans S7.9]EGN97319.1 hypothetical protein SERLA73DRAFT_184000 [Serpula lacrymans var. lacrymans S7.3]EGO22906.1 hypothetical protein SERLADRAFT_471434 [Serpula lacrymans var. lacrymans S7.9]